MNQTDNPTAISQAGLKLISLLSILVFLFFFAIVQFNIGQTKENEIAQKAREIQDLETELKTKDYAQQSKLNSDFQNQNLDIEYQNIQDSNKINLISPDNPLLLNPNSGDNTVTAN